MLAAVQAIAALLVWATSKHWKGAPAAAPGQAGGRAPAGVKATLRLPAVWLGMLIFFVYTGTELSAGQWSYTLLTLGRGIDEIAASTWVALYWGSFTLGRILFGFVVERIDVRKFLRIALMCAMLGAGLLWSNPVEWLGLWGLVLTGFSLAPVFPVLVATTKDRVAPGQVANTLGFQIAAAGLGGSILTSLTGRLAEAISLETIGLFVFILTVTIFANHEALQWVAARKQSQKRPA